MKINKKDFEEVEYILSCKAKEIKQFADLLININPVYELKNGKITRLETENERIIKNEIEKINKEYRIKIENLFLHPKPLTAIEKQNEIDNLIKILLEKD